MDSRNITGTPMQFHPEKRYSKRMPLERRKEDPSNIVFNDNLKHSQQESSDLSTSIANVHTKTSSSSNRIMWYYLGLTFLRIHIFMLLAGLSRFLASCFFSLCFQQEKSHSSLLWILTSLSFMLCIYMNSQVEKEPKNLDSFHKTHIHLHEKILCFKAFVAFGHSPSEYHRRMLKTTVLLSIALCTTLITGYYMDRLMYVDLFLLPTMFGFNAIFTILTAYCFSEFYYLSSEDAIQEVYEGLRRRLNFDSVIPDHARKTSFWPMRMIFNCGLLLMIDVEGILIIVIGLSNLILKSKIGCHEYPYSTYLWIYHFLIQFSLYFYEMVANGLIERIIHHRTKSPYGPSSASGICFYFTMNCIVPVTFPLAAIVLHYFSLIPKQHVFAIVAVCIAWITMYFGRHYCYSKVIQLAGNTPIQISETRSPKMPPKSMSSCD